MQLETAISFAPDFVVVAVDRGHVAKVAEEWALRGFLCPRFLLNIVFLTLRHFAMTDVPGRVSSSSIPFRMNLPERPWK